MITCYRSNTNIHIPIHKFIGYFITFQIQMQQDNLRYYTLTHRVYIHFTNTLDKNYYDIRDFFCDKITCYKTKYLSINLQFMYNTRICKISYVFYNLKNFLENRNTYVHMFFWKIVTFIVWLKKNSPAVFLPPDLLSM